MKTWIPSLPFIAATMLFACFRTRPVCDMHFERFRNADHVVIRTSDGKDLRIVADQSEVKRFIAAAEANSVGWVTPRYGPPVAPIYANFYSSTALLGDLGVGTDFLSAQGCGGFQSLAVLPGNAAALRALLVGGSDSGTPHQ